MVSMRYANAQARLARADPPVSQGFNRIRPYQKTTRFSSVRSCFTKEHRNGYSMDSTLQRNGIFTAAVQNSNPPDMFLRIDDGFSSVFHTKALRQKSEIVLSCIMLL